MRYLAECREFFGQFRREHNNTGSIMPSSRSLARALAGPLAQAVAAGGPNAPPRWILEVGPGTGAVTAEIVKQLGPDDRLDIVEINAHFVAVLKRRFAEEPEFFKHREQVQLIHAPLQEVPGHGNYDFMISGLPLNNFPLRLVREIYENYERLLKPGGVLSYFEYLGIRALKMPFVTRYERRRLKVLGRFLGRRIQRYEIGRKKVFWNMPPAIARHLRFTATREEGEKGKKGEAELLRPRT